VPLDDSHPERIIVPPTEFRKQHVVTYNPLEPPSPAALSHRLEALSIGLEFPLCPGADGLRFDLVAPSPHHLGISQQSSDTSTSSSSPLPRPADGSVDVDSIAEKGDLHQDLLKDSIKNLYKFWRYGREDRPGDRDKELFISTVRHALNGL